jgi:hypothetical protein
MAIQKSDSQAKGQAAAQLLRNGHTREQFVTLTLIAPLWDYAELPHFSEVCAEVLKLGSDERFQLKLEAIKVLAETLYITRRGPTEFQSPEFRDRAKKLAADVPRSRVIELLKSALSDKTVENVMTIAFWIDETQFNNDEEGLLMQTISILLQIVRGNFDGRDVTPKNRRFALEKLAKFKSHGDEIAPTLIDLLRTEKSEIQLDLSKTEFSRGDLVKLLLGSFPIQAKAVLPILEDEYLLLNAKANRLDGNERLNLETLKRIIDQLKAAPAPGINNS